MKTFISILKLFFSILLILAAVAASFQYLYCPVYTFPEPKPFSGNKIFNPYKEIDSTRWKKANFHVHTRSWGGLTDGSKSSELAVDSTYRYLNYDIIGISDYQHVNTYRQNQKDFVPIYEHGFLLPKNHHLIIGATRICWYDFPFPQTRSNKQFIISALNKDTAAVITIAHPRMRKAFSFNDMKYLTGYDCIEVFDHLCYSVAHWDSALSAGRLVYALGDDDNHDITDRFLVGRVCNFVNIKELKADFIIDALKKGQTFACEPNMRNADHFPEKRAHALTLPIVKKIAVENNQLIIRTDGNVAFYKFIGQSGRVKKIIKNSNEVVYDIQPEDSYIRAEIHFADLTVYYMNPVFKYNGEEPEKPSAVIDEMTTMIHRILFYISLAGIILLSVLYLRFRK